MDALQRLLRALADGLRGRAAEDPLRPLASGLYGRATEASEAGGGLFDSGLDGVLDLLDHGEPVLAFEILPRKYMSLTCHSARPSTRHSRKSGGR